ncbi:MAG: hypothetical protein JWR16_2709 [Nevskia sp.]|nr:hypothetical protein [Nevskia sp.]
MNTLRSCWIPLVLVSAFGTIAQAADDGFDDRFYFAPMGSYALTPNSSHLDNGIGGRLVVGKSVVPHLGFDLIGSYIHYQGKTETVSNGGGLCGVPVVGALCPDQQVHQASSSVADVGAGINAFLFRSNHGIYAHVDAMDGNKFVYDGGLGYDLALIHQGLGLRAEALYHKESSRKGEPLFNLGLFIPIGDPPTAPAPPPEPEPVAVVPAQEPPPPPPPPPCETPTPGTPINLAGCKNGDTIVLRGVNFEFNSANLTVNAKTLLDEVAQALTARADLKVEVDGHTDGIGSVNYNQKLSERRADSVKTYLVGKGLDGGRLSAKGFGKSMPIADNATAEGRDLNRRVELKVIDAGGSVDVPVSSGASDTPVSAAPTPEPAEPSTPPAEGATSSDVPSPSPDGTTPTDASGSPAADAH